MDVNQIIELPEAKAEVIKMRQVEVECPCCGCKQTSEPPEGLEIERSFGSRLEVYYQGTTCLARVLIGVPCKVLSGVSQLH